MALSAGLLSSAPSVAAELPAGAAASVGASEVTSADRSMVVDYWRDGGPIVREAAQAALTGSNADVAAFLASTDDLALQDRRVAAARVASMGGSELMTAARTALFGTSDDLTDFLYDGWMAPMEQDNRVRVAQIMGVSGPNVQDAGRAALNGTPEDVLKFLREGQFKQREQDERVQVAQIMGTGGTNMQLAARLALGGSAADIREFLEVGQYVALAKDQEHATVAQLAQQAKEAGKLAARETTAAKTESAKAVQASQFAKEAALKAATEAEAAKGDTAKAARAAGRAATAATQAAASAQTAIEASRAANSSARVAANAASQAAAAAAGAAQAASKARNAAADAAVDASDAHAANVAAQAARTAAAGATLAADAADQAAVAADEAGKAAHSAASAGANAQLAADAAVEASGYAGQSSDAAAEARAAAATARRHAAEANRAAAAAEALAVKAARAAREAGVAARSAATHANNAATFAEEAAKDAGNSAKAAGRSTSHAKAATDAANAATAAVAKAQDIYRIAREVEAEELLGRTNEGIERARDDQAKANARTAGEAALEQAAKDRETERNRLVSEAAKPGADLSAVAASGRKLAVLVMQNGTAWARAAAEDALAGTDDDVIDYLRNGWATAKEGDDRAYVERLAEESETEEVRNAAEAALDGNAATVTEFIDNGQYKVAAQSMRVAIARVIGDAGPVLKESGVAALNSDDPKKFSKFLTRTQFTARTQDERVRAAQLFGTGDPEVKSAARIALEGSPQSLHTFIVSGQYQAQRKDYLAATHVAQIQKMISDAAKVAATAQQNAATAQKVAATARKAAAEATEWAKKASDSSAKAKAYADEAAKHAKAAEASAASAATSAKTARDAANSANVAASDAARSAADATLSSEMAQVSASTAWRYADEAKQSAIDANKDAEEARKAATEAFTIAVKKEREEAEARRKAAVAAKEKAKNDPGARARQMYRCQQGFVPCDPPGFARWCQHNETYCDILAYSDELAAAVDALWNVEKEILGLSELEACMQEKDFEHCSGLAVDALIGAKLRLLDKAYDKLKLLRRICTKCFPPGTKVLMGDGSRKNIEDVQSGALVLATDPVSGRTAVSRVTRQIVTAGDKRFNELTIATRSGPEKLTATHEHPFWSPSQQNWIEAGELTPGTTLLSSDKSTVRVQENRSYVQRQTTYNLSIADIHTYYVLAGETPVLVHNSTCTRFGGILGVAEAANPLMESLRATGKLPGNYVTKAQAAAAGWEPGKALGNRIPGAQIGGDVFENADGLLPHFPGRTWSEADVGLNNMMKRSKQPGTRLVYSNDGLAYVTNDHYKSFYALPNWK
ncbi:polymorphic toxin-type HINT domain-containing protein [Streptomyces graminilatus]|uniref:polymorphic toxin-type HINT domain-containing protein n=1 Tax=Streptomyces graminilatus TaxID=1464070 RepID=UPI0012FF2255|nr:polymorphic toxin-type HINT domain-containing protein [Streptomyces graminilatus]